MWIPDIHLLVSCGNDGLLLMTDVDKKEVKEEKRAAFISHCLCTACWRSACFLLLHCLCTAFALPLHCCCLVCFLLSKARASLSGRSSTVPTSAAASTPTASPALPGAGATSTSRPAVRQNRHCRFLALPPPFDQRLTPFACGGAAIRPKIDTICVAVHIVVGAAGLERYVTLWNRYGSKVGQLGPHNASVAAIEVMNSSTTHCPFHCLSVAFHCFSTAFP